MKLVFLEQAADFPYLVACRVAADGQTVEVLFNPVAAKAADKAKQITSNPLFMALIKSQIPSISELMN